MDAVRERHGSIPPMPDLKALVDAVRSAPGLLGKRDLQIDQAARHRRRRRRADPPRRRVPRGLRRGDLAAVPAGRPVRRRHGRGGHQRLRRARDGRPPARARRHAGQPRRASTPRTVLDGIAWASERLGRPGGRRTPDDRPPARAVGLLHRRRQRDRCAGSAAEPGDVAAGRLRDRRPVHERRRGRSSPRSTTARPSSCATTARRSWRSRRPALCHAARDVSMPGIAGSLLQMIEGAGCGATLDLDRLPRPDGAPLERWLLTFPSFGFLLAAKPEHAEAACCGVHPSRPRVRAVRRVRRHAGPAAGGRRHRGARVGPRPHPAHRAGPSGIAIGWCMTPW